MLETYELIIIWTWSAWLPAWMYASRYNIKNLIIWKMPWWALATSHKVENFPWILSAPWKDIMNNFKEQAIETWSEILYKDVKIIHKTKNWFDVELIDWKIYKSKYILVATWNNYRKLWVKGEIEFIWKWVSYCATCDWMFFRNKDVAIIGGWNTAITEALYLADICNKVYIVHRKDVFRAEDSWIIQARKRNNIEFVLNEEVEEITWNWIVEEIKLTSDKILKVNWIFIAIWSIPNTKLIDDLKPEKDNEGCLIVDKRQETSIKGLYAAWDVTDNSNKFKQTIMSSAEWCLASNSIHEDIIK